MNLNLKELLNNKLRDIDEKTAVAMDIGRERTTKWLLQYTQLVGLALLVGIVIAISLRLWLVVLILFCTLHLQVVFRYSFRTMMGIDLWTNKKVTELPQNNSEDGSKAQPASAR